MKFHKYIKHIRLTGKLVVAMVLVGILPLAIASIVNSMTASSALNDAALNQLESLRAAKKDQIESYFEQIRNQVVTMAEDRMIVDAMHGFKQAVRSLPQELAVTDEQLEQYRGAIADYYSHQFAREFESQNGERVSTMNLVPGDAPSIVAQYQYIANNPNPIGSKEAFDAADDGSRYSALHQKYHPIIRNFLQKFGFYDIFLVDPDSGQIVYSVFKEIDFATSLKVGPYSDTNFARAYAKALTLGNTEMSILEDFEPYLPSYDGPASFIAAPILDGSELIGVLVFQMPVGIINKIMQQRSGLGDTGETYLVGVDQLMRSQSRFSDQNTILVTEVASEATQMIANGQSGRGVIHDHRGTPVLSAYAPLEIHGLDWGIVAETGEEEALSAVGSLANASAVVALIALGLVVVTAILFARSLIRPLRLAVSVAETIAGGDLDNDIRANTKCEVGDLLRALSGMQTNLRDRIEADRQVLEVNTRIKQALDNVSGNVMVADVDHNIVYMNEATGKLMRDSESEIQKDLPSFDASQLVGSSIDSFHNNPAHQRDILGRLDAEHRSEFSIGDLTWSIVANPVMDNDGHRLGTVIELTDRTLELATEQEVQRVVESALNGDLSERITLDGKSGFFSNLSKAVNDLVALAEKLVDDTLRVFSSMALGDLTQTIESDYQGSFDRLKQDANTTVAKLTEIVGQIQASSRSVKDGAGEISQGNTNLSQRTEEQASNLEETASSMEEMTSTVKRNANNAMQAHELATTAREQAEKGGAIVSAAVTAMDEINGSSQKISDIIGVIDKIAFQTNLLALNASVEAARAGDQGRGFAVVASEVRNLAGRSATAAKEIKDLIEDSGGKVNEGSRLVNRSGEALQEIVDRVQEVSDIVGEIANASREQANGIDEANRAISQMDGLTQENAALVEQAAAASESLDEQADRLNQMMAFFSTPNPSNSAHSEQNSTVHARLQVGSADSSDPLRDCETLRVRRQPADANGSDSEWLEF